MLCEKCGKNHAVVHYQQNINGHITEYHLCSECAAGIEAVPTFGNMFSGFLNGFSIPHEFMGKSHSHEAVCPNCSSTLESIRKSGKIGCGECYDSFREYLDGVLAKIQPATAHTGKVPKKAGGEIKTQREIENLKLKLGKAIENEEYEEAAKLRDRIRELEKGE